MKRLLLALLAVLTGIAAAGTPVVAAVEVQGPVAITASTVAEPQHGVDAHRPADERAGMAMDGIGRAQELPRPLAWMGPAVHLKADRAHE